MKFQEALSLSDVASFLEAKFAGNPDADVTGMNEIHKVGAGDITFVDFHKYYDKALNSAATFVIIDKEVECPPGKGLIFSDDPFRDFNKLAVRFRPFQPQTEAIHPSTIIGKGTVIQPGVVVGARVSIGRDVIIHPNVTIYSDVEIGDRTIIQAGTVIGGEAFYFKNRKDRKLRHDKLLTTGSVRIEHDVEIGAACTIDRGVSGVTIIGAGTKMDNQVHIGHGTVIGKNCLIAAQVGIAGKVHIEDNVTIWGQVGISKDLRIVEGVEIYAQSGVASGISEAGTWFGSPALPARQQMRILGVLKELPKAWSKLRNL